MLLTITIALLAILFLAGAVHAYRMTPTLENRIKSLASMLIAIALFVTAAVIMPGAIEREAAAQASRDRVKLAAQVEQITALSAVLGGPAGYIEYLKATKSD